MYQPFHKLRVRFAELEMKQGEVAKRANMAESTLTARMTGRLPWKGDEIAAVAKVLGIPTDQIGTFFFEDAPKGGKGAAGWKISGIPTGNHQSRRNTSTSWKTAKLKMTACRPWRTCRRRVVMACRSKARP